MKSTIEISAARLRANFAAIQQAAGPEFQLLCVIKADAYGHSAELCAQTLVEAGAQWLGVADLEEGVRVRNALLHAGLANRPVHILVMCAFEPDDTPGILEHFLTPVIWTPDHVQALERVAESQDRRINVHIEIDTGMARQGATPGPELNALLAALHGARYVRVEGVFSHLSSSEVAGSLHTTSQLSRFGFTLEQLSENGPIPEYLHLGNSSAVDEGSTLDWLRDFALNDLSATPLLRPGLALYGYTLPITGSPALPEPARPEPAPSDPASPTFHPALQARLAPQLQPVATWKTRIIGLRDLAPGDAVGYGATFTAPEPMRAALIPVGYADGFRREASSGVGNGWVMIHGQKAPVLGRVSMNLTVVDITNHTAAPAIGDEVTLLGEGVTAHDHAAWCHTIPYEILCAMRGHHRLM